MQGWMRGHGLAATRKVRREKAELYAKMLEKLTIKHLGTERNGLKPPSQRCRPLMMLVLLTSASPLRPSAIGGKIAVIVGRCVAAPVGDYGGGGLLGAIVQGFSPGGLLAEIDQLVRRG